MKKVLLIAAVALCAMGCCKKAEKCENEGCCQEQTEVVADEATEEVVADSAVETVEEVVEVVEVAE